MGALVLLSAERPSRPAVLMGAVAAMAASEAEKHEAENAALAQYQTYSPLPPVAARSRRRSCLQQRQEKPSLTAAPAAAASQSSARCPRPSAQSPAPSLLAPHCASDQMADGCCSSPSCSASFSSCASCWPWRWPSTPRWLTLLSAARSVPAAYPCCLSSSTPWRPRCGVPDPSRLPLTNAW